jgi:hypothetical protein
MAEKDEAAAKARGMAHTAREDLAKEREVHEEVAQGLHGRIQDLELRLNLGSAAPMGSNSEESMKHVTLLHSQVRTTTSNLLLECTVKATATAH